MAIPPNRGETGSDNRPPVDELLQRPKKTKTLAKAIDRPAARWSPALEDQPVGWDTGPRENLLVADFEDDADAQALGLPPVPNGPADPGTDGTSTTNVDDAQTVGGAGGTEKEATGEVEDSSTYPSGGGGLVLPRRQSEPGGLDPVDANPVIASPSGPEADEWHFPDLTASLDTGVEAEGEEEEEQPPANRPPTITGPTTGTVVEDDQLSASGQLVGIDPEAGDITWSLHGGSDGDYGEFTVDDDGLWTYMLDNAAAQSLRAGQTMQEVFTVRATDAAGAITDRQVAVTISGTNDTPVVGGIRVSAVSEDDARATGQFTVSDVDIGDFATWSITGPSNGNYGALTVDDSGLWTFTLNDHAQSLRAGDRVREIFTVRVTDAWGGAADQQVSITVTGTNDAPVISGSQTGAVTEEGAGTTTGQLSAVDVDTDDTATWSIVGSNNGTYGSFSLDATGRWSFALDTGTAQSLRAGETAQETFAVRVTDAEGAIADQRVTITVVGTNDVPVISGSATGSVAEDHMAIASGRLTATDVDIGDSLSWSLPNGGAGGYGALTLDGAGNWTYTLDNGRAQGLKAGETVQEIFTVRVTDATGGTADQQVTVTVTGSNDLPAISGTHTGVVSEDTVTTASGTLVATDVDVGDGATWSLPNGGAGSYGALALDGAGNWTYTLDLGLEQGLKAGETVQEIFTVRVTDNAGGTAEQQVTITVTGTNDVPVISGSYAGVVGEDAALTATGKLVATDADLGDTAAWSLPDGGDGAYGALTVDADGRWTYTLDNDLAQGLKAGEAVLETFVVRVADASGATTDQQVSVIVTGTNDAPVITGTHAGAVTEDVEPATATGTLMVTDVDIGETASWSINGPSYGSYGSLTLDSAGNWTYTLDNQAAQVLKAGETVQEVFSVRVTDVEGATTDQQVTITVTGTNDEPVIAGSFVGEVVEDAPTPVAVGRLTTSDVDIGDTATWSVVGPTEGEYGTFALDSNGVWTFTLDNEAAQSLEEDDRVQELFTVRVTDRDGGTAEQQVIVTVVGTNDVPVISGVDMGVVAEDGQLIASGTLIATDADKDDTILWSVVGSDDGAYGEIAIDDDGNWTYVLNNAEAQELESGELVQEIFTIRATDGEGATVDQQVTITIVGLDDPPVISGVHTGTVVEDEALTASGTLVATDLDEGDTMVWSNAGPSEGLYGDFAIDAAGAWTYTLDNTSAQALGAGESAIEIFTVQVTDDEGAVVEQLVTVTVTGTNDDPVISGTHTAAVGEDATLSATGALSAADVDVADTLTWSILGSSEGAYGGLALDADGKWTYTLDNNAAQSLKAGETAQEIFTVRVADDEGGVADQQVTVTVTGTNDTPVISGTQTGAVAEDEALIANGTLSAADLDVGDTATWSVVGSDSSYGAFAVDPVTGHWSYTLDNDAAQSLKDGATAQETFTVRVTDAAGATADQQVTITVTGTNDAPLITGSYTGAVTEDTVPTATGKLIDADVDVGDTADWSVPDGGQGSYGALTIAADGTWTYTLDSEAAQALEEGQTVDEVFTVRVTDALGATADHQVIVSVTGTNDVPEVSGTDTGAVKEDVALTVSGTLVATDADVGDVVEFEVEGPSRGLYGDFVVDDDDGLWTYTLDNAAAQGLRAGETVQEIFTVEVVDEAGGSTDHQVTITVTGTNDVPVISGAQTGAIVEDTALTTGGVLIASDADIGDTASWSIVGNPDSPYGEFTLDAGGSWTYRLDNAAAQSLDQGQTAQEVFTVRVTDGSGATADQRVTVTITGTNDAPVISGTQTGAVTEDSIQTATGVLTVTDADLGDTAAWSLPAGGHGDYGSLSIDAAGRWTYALDNVAAQKLASDETVDEIFTVRVTDAHGAITDQQVRVTVTGTNDAPVISGSHTGIVTEDTVQAATGTLSVTDVDVGDTTTWSVVGSPTGGYGAFALDPATGNWTYTLDNQAAQGLKAGQSVQEIFTVRVTDAEGATTDQQVTVTVKGSNDAPVISGTQTGAVTEDTSLATSGQLTVADVDVGDTASWSIVGEWNSPYGSLSVNPTTGRWTYTLDNQAAQSLKAGEAAQEIFTVRVTDAAGVTGDKQVTVNISGTNDLPVISGSQTGAVTEDGPLTTSGQLTATDLDVGDTAAWSVVGGGDSPYGALSVDPATGQWTYSLDNVAAQSLKAGTTVKEIFTVRVTDAAGGIADKQVAVTITGSNDAPTISGSLAGTVTEDNAETVSGVLHATDVDIGDTAVLSLPNGGTGNYGTLSFDEEGTWTYDLDHEAAQGLKAGETVQEIFLVRATDAQGATAEQQVTITVVGTNDAPVITGTRTGAVTEDSALSASGTLTATDADIGDTGTWSVVGLSDSPYGSLAVDPATGQWTYTLDNAAAQSLKAGQTAQENFTVRVTDAAGATSDQQVSITVTGSNDAPAISGSQAGEVTEDAQLTTTGQLTVADIDVGDNATWSVVGVADSPYGALSINPATGRWTYALDNLAAQGLSDGETVQEIFTVRVTDSSGATADKQITVTVRGANDGPAIGGSHTGTVIEDTVPTASGALIATDPDLGSDPTWSLPTGGTGSYGSLTVDADGHWVYTMDTAAAQALKGDETVQEIFTVRATDGQGATADTQVTITVVGTNDAPVIAGSHTAAVAEDGVLAASGTLTVSDADVGDSATWSVVGNTGAYGAFAFDPATGQWTYTLDNQKAQALKAGETAQEIFTVRVTDAQGATTDQQVTVTIAGSNDVPVISGTQSGAVEEDETMTAVGVLTASDADTGDTITWSIVGNPDSYYGALSVDPATGRWVYHLDDEAVEPLKDDETVQEIFTIRATDSSGATTDQQVTIAITGENDAPVITGSHTGAVAEDTAQTASGQLTATDTDANETATWSIVGTGSSHHGAFSIDAASGEWTYTLDNAAAQAMKEGETAQDTFTVRVTDSQGATTDQQITVTVTGTNDLPVISGVHTGAVVEDNVAITEGQLSAADADVGDTATWSIAGNYGLVVADAEGNWNFVPDGNNAELGTGETIQSYVVLTEYGEMYVSPDGYWIYNLDPGLSQGLRGDETVQEIVTVRVTDSAGATVDQQVTVTITGTNDAPVISGTSVGTVIEDADLSTTGQLTVSDVDIGDTAAWSIVGNPDSPYGALFLDPATGQWTYTLDNVAAQSLQAGQTAQETFTVRVTDGSGAAVDQQVTITVTGSNDAPTISGTRTGAVTEDMSQVTTGMLSRTDLDVGDTATWSIVGSGDSPYGGFSIDPATGHWTYTLDNAAAQPLKAGETVQEIFTVRVTDAQGATAEQQVTVTINGSNDTPTIGGSVTGAVTEDTALTASAQLTVTDTDVGDTATWSLPTGGTGRYGSLTIGTDGLWTYTLDNVAAQSLKAGTTAQEFFTVRATDASGAAVNQQVTVTVTGTNDLPVISGTHTGAVAEDTILTATGALSAADPDIGDTLAWSITGPSTGAYGSLVLAADGHWTYSLDNIKVEALRAGQTVQEVFTVRATDGSGGTVDQQVTVTVTGTNDAPAISGTRTGSVTEDSVLSATGKLTATDLDVGDTAAWSLPNGGTGSYGSLALAADGQWTYALNNAAAQSLKAGATVQEIFTVRVTDGSGAMANQQVTVTVTGSNDAPAITGTSSGTVVEDIALTATGQLTANDPDIGDTRTWSIAGTNQGSYGALALNATGNWTYTLNNAAAQGLKAGETRQEFFTVRVTDASGANATQQVTVTVTGTNDKPVISGTTTGAVTEDVTSAATGNLTATDADIGDTAAWSLPAGGAGAYGNLTLTAGGQWAYTLNVAAAQSLAVGQKALETFTVRLTDASGGTTDQQVTVTVTGTNDAPVVGQAVGNLGMMKEEASFSFTTNQLLTAAKVTDVDLLDKLTVTNVTLGPSSPPGTLTDNHDGTWTYRPGSNVSNVTPEFVFTVSDGHTTVNAKASVTVQPVVDPALTSLGATTVREVIDTGSSANMGRIVEDGLTSAPLSEFTLEVSLLAKDVSESTGSTGPVIVNIGSETNNNLLTLWNPASLTVGFIDRYGTLRNIDTNVDLTDGQNHRLTVTWDTWSDTLRIYDNGTQILSTTMRDLPGDTYIAIAQKSNDPPTYWDPDGGGFRTDEHFQGDIYNVTMSNKAETPAQVASGSLAEQQPTRLILDLRAKNGQIVDTTGRYIDVDGGMHPDTLVANTDNTSIPAGSKIDIDIATLPTDPADTVTRLQVSGFLAGTVVSDGIRSVTVLSTTQKIDVTNWRLDDLTAKLPNGVKTSMTLTVEAVVTTPAYPTGEVDGNGQPIMKTDSMIVTDQQQILIEYAPEAGVAALSESEAPSLMATSLEAQAEVTALETPVDESAVAATALTTEPVPAETTTETAIEPAAATGDTPTTESSPAVDALATGPVTTLAEPAVETPPGEPVPTLEEPLAASAPTAEPVPATVDTTVNPYLQFVASPEATATEPSPSDPYLGLTETAVEPTPQEPPPADQVYADAIVASTETPAEVESTLPPPIVDDADLSPSVL